MPLYDMICPNGHEFETYAGYDERNMHCTNGHCKQTAHRIVKQIGGVIYNAPGFTLRAEPQPPRNDAERAEQQVETRKEMHKRGWNEDRLYTELRKNVQENRETGKKEIVTAALPKSVDKHGK